MVLDQLVQGINDKEIQKKVLAYSEAEFNLEHIEKLVATEECERATQKDSKARDHTSDLALTSTYRKDKTNQTKTTGNGCNGGKEKEYDIQALLQLFNGLDIASSLTKDHRKNRKHLGHMRYDKERGEFIDYTFGRNNVMHINIKTDGSNYNKIGGRGRLRPIKLTIQEGVANTGASLCCCMANNIRKYGLKEEDLIKSNVSLYAADRRKLKIKGHIQVKITARSKEGKPMVISNLLYFVEGLKGTYLSKDAMEQMRIIPKDFPVAGAAAIEGKTAGEPASTD